jgi:hypothetical protein
MRQVACNGWVDEYRKKQYITPAAIVALTPDEAVTHRVSSLTGWNYTHNLQSVAHLGSHVREKFAQDMAGAQEGVYCTTCGKKKR